ncbi:hypothetical protein [Corynebacterium renale]|uniref:Uncharacterized protein n=1 Tax=Corynebacterium renale TaxID=1724 RepID=A0A2A9DLK1_9CORY|nr:hypothetical protein [Corynebacterium renale]PFG27246.1 hypothetical protein ATK06_0297 [Corynebacterium renale]SQI23669.1 Uncharacterised protein [Corynebacterium renale]
MSSHDQQNSRALEPKGSPSARWWAIIVALLLLAVAVVTGRELLLRNFEGIRWESWIDPVLDSLATNDYHQWMTIASVVALVVGLIFFIAGVKPRPRTHSAIPAEVSLWARPVDIARHLTAFAKRQPGVQNATTTVRKNKITQVVTIQAKSTTGEGARTTTDADATQVAHHAEAASAAGGNLDVLIDDTATPASPSTLAHRTAETIRAYATSVFGDSRTIAIDVKEVSNE